MRRKQIDPLKKFR